MSEPLHPIITVHRQLLEASIAAMACRGAQGQRIASTIAHRIYQRRDTEDVPIERHTVRLLVSILNERDPWGDTSTWTWLTYELSLREDS